MVQTPEIIKVMTFLNRVNPWAFCVGVRGRGMTIGRRRKRLHGNEKRGYDGREGPWSRGGR